MKTMVESNIEFSFDDADEVIKFDDSSFYRHAFNHLPESKGVDFLLVDHHAQKLFMIEVKNCKGEEHENRWRISPNDRKLDTTGTMTNTRHRHSLDIEVASKVAMTLSCLVGTHTCSMQQRAKELLPYWKYLAKDDPSIYVLLLLEGDFQTVAIPKKKIMNDLALYIERKLTWLKCKVFVEDTQTHRQRIFSARAL